MALHGTLKVVAYFVAEKSIEKHVNKVSKRNNTHDDSKNCSEEFNFLKDDHETDCELWTTTTRVSSSMSIMHAKRI